MPWFWQRGTTAVGVAGLLYVGVFALRLSGGTATDAINMLYALPIALLALAFGLRAGALAGAVAVLLTTAWVLVDGVGLTALGWASRIIPMLLLGILLGDASDRLRSADERRRALENAAQRHRDAVEINDTLVQGMSAARWSFEAGRHEAGLAALTQTIELGHELVSKLLREAGMGVDGHRPPTTGPDDRPDDDREPQRDRVRGG